MSKRAILILVSLLVIGIVYGAGGGGGGSGGSSGPCTSDFFKCGVWSECVNGQQTRTCELTEDCENANDPKPDEAKPCQEKIVDEINLKCGDKTTLKERVMCRLNLTEDELRTELSLRYLPEECRVIENQTERQDCVNRYARLQVCWNKAIGEERFSCVREKLSLGNDISQEKANCNSKLNVERDGCFNDLRKKVYNMIKFRFYDLEERAEEMEKLGVNEDRIAEFVTNLELKKQVFNNAKTKEERKQIILDVRKLWVGFIRDAREQIK